LLFLIDAQLPPALAEALRNAACEAVHVADLGLLTATDQRIWDEAIFRSAVLITKDRDFSLLRASSSAGPASFGFEWVTPTSNPHRSNIELAVSIINAIERGETVIEFVGR